MNQILDTIYANCRNGNSDSALDILFDWIDGLLLKGEFEECDEFLRKFNLDMLNIDLMIGLLSITLAATEKLPYRKMLVKEIEARLKKIVPERVERLLRGLK